MLNPNDGNAITYLGLYLIYTGQAAAALEMFEASTRGNPFHPTYYHWFIGLAHFIEGDCNAAVAALEQAVDLFPGFVTPHRHLAACHAQLGNHARAAAECQRVLELEPDFSVRKLARTLAYQDPARRKRYCAALRLAGLPD